MVRLHSTIISIWLFLSVCSLASCSSGDWNMESGCYPDDPAKWVVCNKELGYTLWYPRWIECGKTECDVEVYTYKSLPSPHCENIGVSTPEVNGDAERGIRTIRGEVDEVADGSQPTPNCLVKSIYPEKNPLPYQSSYALCSEKGGRQVFICIQQVTDDPALANSILDTFRWTN